MSIAARLLPPLLALLLAGCLEMETLISVRGDGSGTVREQVRLSGQAVEMIRQMGGAEQGFMRRAELEARASRMGAGVKLVSAEETSDAGSLGYAATWAFEDVSTLRVEQDAEGAMPQSGGGGGEPDASPSATFAFEPGPPAVLTVLSSLAEQPAADTAAPEPPAETQEVPPEVIREMFGGMRLRLAVEVEGDIVETNASHVDGSRVTLFALDFDRLLENAEALEALAATSAPDPLQMKEMLRGLPGLEVETEQSLRIAFAPGAPAGAAQPGGAALPAEDSTAGAATAAPEAAPAASTSGDAGTAKTSSGLATGSVGGFSWQAVAVAEAARLTGDLVAVRAADGALVKGLVLGVDGDLLRLRRAVMDGGGTVELRLPDIRELHVFRSAP